MFRIVEDWPKQASQPFKIYEPSCGKPFFTATNEVVYCNQEVGHAGSHVGILCGTHRYMWS